MRLTAGANHEVVFQLLLVAVVHQVDVLVDRRETDFAEKGNIGAPSCGIVANEIVHLRELWFFGHGSTGSIRLQQPHAHEWPGRGGLAQGHGHLARFNQDRVTRRAGNELNSASILTFVAFECQRLGVKKVGKART